MMNASRRSFIRGMLVAGGLMLTAPLSLKERRSPFDEMDITYKRPGEDPQYTTYYIDEDTQRLIRAGGWDEIDENGVLVSSHCLDLFEFITLGKEQ